MIAADVQPVQNLSVLKHLSDDNAVQMEWGRWVVESGLSAFEKSLQSNAGTCCFGDLVTMADVCLVPQVFNADRFRVDMSRFPVVSRVHDGLVERDAFKSAHPSVQPDCPLSQVAKLFHKISSA